MKNKLLKRSANDSFATILNIVAPERLTLILAPVLIGATDVLLWQKIIDWKRLLGCIVIAVFLQISAHLFLAADEIKEPLNDKNDKRLTKIKPLQLRILGALCLAIVAITGFFTVPFHHVENIIIWFAGAFAMIAAITFSAKGIAYGKRGFAEVISFIFYGLVAVMGTEAVVSNSIGITRGIFWSIACGALPVAMLQIKYLRDMEKDKTEGNFSFAARYGKEIGLKIFFWGVFLPAIASAMLAAFHPLLWGATIIMLLGGARLHSELKKAKKDKEYDSLFFSFSMLVGAWCVAVILGLFIK